MSGVPVKPVLTKKVIAILYGYYSPHSMVIYSHKLREMIFTDDFLNRIGLAFEDYRKMKSFPPEVSLTIQKELNISDAEIKEAYGFI